MRFPINQLGKNLKTNHLSNFFTHPKHIFCQKRRFLVTSKSKMGELLVGVCQMTSGSDVGKNAEVCKRLISTAKQRGAKVC